MKAVVFAGADIKDYGFCGKYTNNAYIVCCDSGMRHALKLGITPDCIVGDFDSTDMETFEFFKKKGVPVKTFPTHKDENDTLLGIEAAIDHGADEIIIIGGIGNRMDHTLANCNLLYYIHKKGIKAVMANEKNEIFVVDREIEIFGEKGEIISMIPLSMEVGGITTYGLEYPLYNGALSKDGRLIAVSNVMLDDYAKITVKEGCLLVMKCRD